MLDQPPKNAAGQPNKTVHTSEAPVNTSVRDGWQPFKTDSAGTVWEWEYREGATRIIVGPVEKVYIEGLQKRLREQDQSA